MPPIYITEQGTKVRFRNNCIRVERETDAAAEKIWEAPIGTVSQIILSGNIGLTTPAIAAFLDRQIDVVFLDSRGNFRGRLQNGADPHVSIRRGQYRAVENKAFCIALVRGLVGAKLRHQEVMLQRQNRERPDPKAAEAIQKLSEGEASLAERNTVNALRGVEGASAAAYFTGLRQFIDPIWKFRRREKNPSPDPVNAMLSFGYTLLTQLSVSAVQTVGLDPYAGFLHQESYNRPSLGLDLMEEFRPIVDGIVLNCCESGRITPDDFTPDTENRTCWMNPDAKKLFIREFEFRMDDRFTHPVTGTKLTLRQCLLEQARQIAVSCEQAPEIPEYIPMGFK